MGTSQAPARRAPNQARAKSILLGSARATGWPGARSARARPAATRSAPATSSRYVRVSPVSAWMIAGLSPHSRAGFRISSQMEWVGGAMGGQGLRKIMGILVPACYSMFCEDLFQLLDGNGFRRAASRADGGRAEQGIVDRLFGGFEHHLEQGRHCVGAQCLVGGRCVAGAFDADRGRGGERDGVVPASVAVRRAGPAETEDRACGETLEILGG